MWSKSSAKEIGKQLPQNALKITLTIISHFFQMTHTDKLGN